MRTVLTIVALGLVYLLLREVTGDWLVAIPIMVAVFLPLLALGKRARYKDETANQRTRDRHLQEDLDREVAALLAEGMDDAALSSPSSLDVERQVVATSRSAKRILFLRPFLIDNAFRVRNPRVDGIAARIIPFYDHILPARVSLDDGLRYHLRGYGGLVAIGAPGEVVGASRVRVGDEIWQNYFTALASQALVLVVFPGLRPGTLWEIGSIRKNPNLLAKTIFVLPPYVAANTPDFPSAKTIVLALRPLGFEFPDDVKAGEAFVFDGRGTIRLRQELLRAGVRDYWLAKNEVRSCVDAILAPRQTRRAIGELH